MLLPSIPQRKLAQLNWSLYLSLSVSVSVSLSLSLSLMLVVCKTSIASFNLFTKLMKKTSKDFIIIRRLHITSFNIIINTAVKLTNTQLRKLKFAIRNKMMTSNMVLWVFVWRYALNGLMCEDIKTLWDYLGTYDPLSRKISALPKQTKFSLWFEKLTKCRG